MDSDEDVDLDVLLPSVIYRNRARALIRAQTRRSFLQLAAGLLQRIVRKLLGTFVFDRKDRLPWREARAARLVAANSTPLPPHAASRGSAQTFSSMARWRGTRHPAGKSANDCIMVIEAYNSRNSVSGKPSPLLVAASKKLKGPADQHRNRIAAEQQLRLQAPADTEHSSTSEEGSAQPADEGGQSVCKGTRVCLCWFTASPPTSSYLCNCTMRRHRGLRRHGWQLPNWAGVGTNKLKYLEHQAGGPGIKKNQTGTTKLLGDRLSLTTFYNVVQAKGGIGQVCSCCVQFHLPH